MKEGQTSEQQNVDATQLASTKNKGDKREIWLIVLCWLVYTCSYIGKLSYNANITQIEVFFAVEHDAAGLVGTFFFFAYGVGQIVNGLLCKKYNIRFVVLGSLLLSGGMNFAVAFTANFTLLKYFWLVNGAALSVLWTSLIRLLSENLSKKDVGRAVVIMGTTVATGTFLVYGLSALFVAFNNFHLIFYVAGSLLPIIGVVWLIFYPFLTTKNAIQEEEKSPTIPSKEGGRYAMKGIFVVFIVLAVYAVVNNLVKDGLTTWVPTILKELYKLPDYVSILLTLLLPVLAIFGATVAVWLRKWIKSFVALGGVLFLCATVLIGAVILLLPQNAFVVTLCCFALVSCLMSGVNNVVTSMVPLYWKDKINSGKTAGILNGFCYLGSTISSYGLGFISNFGGWEAVFWTLFGLAGGATIAGFIYEIIQTALRLKNKKQTEKTD